MLSRNGTVGFDYKIVSGQLMGKTIWKLDGYKSDELQCSLFCKICWKKYNKTFVALDYK